MERTIQDILNDLGNEFYEIKKLVAGGYCAYSPDERAVGKTFKEALENLWIAVEKRHDAHEKEIYGED